MSVDRFAAIGRAAEFGLYVVALIWPGMVALVVMTIKRSDVEELEFACRFDRASPASGSPLWISAESRTEDVDAALLVGDVHILPVPVRLV
jgi:hypothetical protein